MNTILLNNKNCQIQDNELDLYLLDFLRERQFLTGTKGGCEKGLCGSCTVLVNNKAVKACRTKVSKIIDASVVTIEGMENPDGSLHILQSAFIDAGAIQCGFCTPGMIMSAYALLFQNQAPNRNQIKEAMKANLCRCTGYQQIIDAIENTANIIKETGKLPLPGCFL